MNSYTEYLSKKYTNKIIPKDNVNDELNSLIKNKIISNGVQKINEDISIDKFINYVDALKRNSFLNNNSVFKDSGDMNEDLNETYADVSDFIDESKNKKMEIMKDVVEKFVRYEKLNLKVFDKKKQPWYIVFVLFVVIVVIMHMRESEPY
ncbi:hypothetical protein GVAV_002120 [Gurleya vavrai]